MKKMVVSILVAGSLGVLAVSPVLAQFGGLGGLVGAKSSGGGGDVESQVKGFTEKSSQVQGLVYTSLKAIQAAYAKTEDAAKIAEEVKAFNAITDPKEKAAKTAEVLKSDAAKVEELSKAKDAQERTKNLSKDKQKLLVQGVSNLTVAGIRASELGQSGSGIVQGASSSPMDLGKVVPVKDALPILADSASVSTKVVPELLKIMKGANVAVPTVTAESKTEDPKF